MHVKMAVLKNVRISILMHRTNACYPRLRMQENAREAAMRCRRAHDVQKQCVCAHTRCQEAARLLHTHSFEKIQQTWIKPSCWQICGSSSICILNKNYNMFSCFRAQTCGLKCTTGGVTLIEAGSTWPSLSRTAEANGDAPDPPLLPSLTPGARNDDCSFLGRLGGGESSALACALLAFACMLGVCGFEERRLFFVGVDKVLLLPGLIAAFWAP
jgi:hypothetical protein